MDNERTEMCGELMDSPCPTTETARLFLVGAERSGTTLLRLMLDHHPEVTFHFEFEYVVDKLGPDRRHGWPDVARFCRWLHRNRIFYLSGFEADASLSYVQLVDSFLNQQQERSGGKRFVGATVHRDFDKLPWIWPNARFIHIVRDGRDVARSVVRMGWAGNAFDASEHWLEAQETWRRLKPRLSRDHWIEVRYEDLVSDPVAVLRDICQFIGVDYEPEMLGYHRDSTYDVTDATMAYQWKRKSSPSELQLIESQLAGELLRQGYELSGEPSIRVSPLRRWALRFHSRIGRCRFRCRRYGPMLVAQDFVARRVGTTAFRRSIEKRIQEIDLQWIR